MFTAIFERQVTAGCQVDDGAGYEDFPRGSGRLDTGSKVYGDTAEIAFSSFNFSCVDAGSQLQT